MKEYTVHFIRADEQPEEIYYYHTLEEAKWHLHLFDEDDSELYQKIEVRNKVGNVLDKIIFEVADMSNWREWKIGDTIRYSWNEFDGSGSTVGFVTEVEADHIIVRADDMNLWCEDFNCDMFQKIESKNNKKNAIVIDFKKACAKRI